MNPEVVYKMYLPVGNEVSMQVESNLIYINNTPIIFPLQEKGNYVVTVKIQESGK